MNFTTRTPTAAAAVLGGLVFAALAGCTSAGPGASAPNQAAANSPERTETEPAHEPAPDLRYAAPGTLAETSVYPAIRSQTQTDTPETQDRQARTSAKTDPDPAATAPQSPSQRPAAGRADQPRAETDRSAAGRLRALDLDRVRAGVQLVPRAQVGDLPGRLAALDRAEARKRLFLKSMLPAVLKANAALARQRDFVEAVAALDIPRSELPAEMRERLDRLARRYRVETGDVAELKRRVDVVPPALVLAQAAIETGWGSSRFAQQGNAIFGQHTSDPDAPGMVPQGLEDPDFRVRAFETVGQAVQAYMRNLNTHPAYARLRAIRAEQRARGARPDAIAMAAGLVDYSARGQAYVEDLRLTIRANDLQQFAEARLRPSPERLVDASPFGLE